MNGSGLRRRDVLVAASAGCVTLAGCGSGDPEEGSVSETTTALRSGYGSAYGRGYGGE